DNKKKDIAHIKKLSRPAFNVFIFEILCGFFICKSDRIFNRLKYHI
ncbi:unnamed protein product, partial [marine sediment metagenome]